MFQPYIALTMSSNGNENISSYIPYEQHVSHFLEEVYHVTNKNDLLNISLGNISETNGIEMFAVIDSLSAMIEHTNSTEEAVRLTLMRAVAYSSSLNYQDALNDIEKVLKEQPDNFVALWQKTVCSAMMAEYEKGTTAKENDLRNVGIIDNFNKLLKASPDNPMILYCLGTYYARRAEYDKAIDCVSKAILHSPQMPYAYYNRGLAYQKTGKSAEARKDFSKSGELGLYGAYNLLKK